MAREIKSEVRREETLDLLEIRLGRITSAERHTSSGKPAYKMTIDFGKFGQRISVGKFTNHPMEEVVGCWVVGVLNIGTKTIDGVHSNVLVLGIQYPKAPSEEASFLTPLVEKPRIGGKIF